MNSFTMEKILRANKQEDHIFIFAVRMNIVYVLPQLTHC